MASVPPVNIHFHANTAQAQAAMAQLSTQLTAVGGAANRTRMTLGGMMHNFKNIGVGVAAITAVYKSFQLLNDTISSTVKVNADFEQAMQHVKAVSEQNVGFTIAQFKEMEAEARRLGATTRFTAVEAAEGLKFLSMAGLSAKESTQALESTLRLAQAGALDLGRAADIVTNIMTAFNASFEDTGRFVDVLAKAAANANTDVEQLAMGMKFVAPVASGLGRSLEETTAAMMTLSNAGIQSAMSGTGLRMLLSTLSNQSGRTVRELEALGLEFDKFDPSRNSLVQTLNELQKVTVLPDGTAQLMKAFTQRSGAAALVLGRLVDNVEDFEKMLLDAEGAADQMAGTMDDSLAAAVKLAKSAFTELQLQLGKGGILSALRDIVDGVAQFLVDLRDSGDAGNVGRDIAVGLRTAADMFASVSKALGPVIKAFYALRSAIFAVVAAIGVMAVGHKFASMQMSIATKKQIAEMGRLRATVAAASINIKKNLKAAFTTGALIVLFMLFDHFMSKAQNELMTLKQLGDTLSDSIRFGDDINKGLKGAKTEDDIDALKEQISLRRRQLQQQEETLMADAKSEKAQKDIYIAFQQQYKQLGLLEGRIDRNAAGILKAAAAAQRTKETLSEWTDELMAASENANDLLEAMEKADKAAAERKAKIDSDGDAGLEADLLLMVHGLEDVDEARQKLQDLKDKAAQAIDFEGLSQEDLTANLEAMFAGLSKAEKDALRVFEGGMEDDETLMKRFVETVLVSDEELEQANELHKIIEKIEGLRRKAREDAIKAAKEKVEAQSDIDMNKAIMNAKLRGDEEEVKRLKRKQAIKKKTLELEKKGLDDAAKQAEELVDLEQQIADMESRPDQMRQSGSVAGAINTIMGRTTEAQIAAETTKARKANEKTAEESEKTRKATEELRDLLASQGRFT